MFLQALFSKPLGFYFVAHTVVLKQFSSVNYVLFHHILFYYIILLVYFTIYMLLMFKTAVFGYLWDLFSLLMN